MLDFFLSYFLVYTYAILFVVVFLASFGIPLPATALVLAAGAFASQGYLDTHLVLVTVFFASVAGDNAIFHGIYRYGHEGIEKVQLGKLLKTNTFLVVETKISQYASLTIFFSRWLFVSVGPLVNIVAGLAKVSKKRFLLWDLGGEGIYSIVFVGIGYTFGAQWDVIYGLIQDIASILLLCVTLFILVGSAHRYRKKWRSYT